MRRAVFVFTVLLAARAAPAEGEAPFGEITTAEVRSVERDRPHALGNGVYGRFDGDLDVGAAAGAAVDFTDGSFGVGGKLSALWYFTGGPYLAYQEALSDDGQIPRRLGFGIELRPLFLLRWNQDLQRGPAIFDLTLDSLALSLGMSLDGMKGRGFAARRGFELGFGFGIPLLARAPGPWLETRGAIEFPNLGDRSVTLLALVSWHFALVTPLVASGNDLATR